ncbi:MAG: 4-hydroxythreonine-4-phosphate dehydrogenase PdxA [Bacteroidia bacterium]
MSADLRIGITIGDYNGIGPELVVRSLQNPLIFNYCTPVVYANTFVIKHYCKLLGINDLDFHIVKDNKIIPNKINLRVCSKDRIEITPGTTSDQSGKFALDSIDMAIQDVKDGLIQNIVTCPIDKQSAKAAGIGFNGHTEYFAKAFESEVLMMLVQDNLKVAMATGHTALDEVSNELQAESIINGLKSLEHSLKYDFNISHPRIAVLGLNPHNGDNGLMGEEEIKLISPSIKTCFDDGMLVYGPFSPDGFFGSGNSAEFDAVFGMYHDQVLIPFKQNSFEDGVNFTAGLPMVRTSPDHGTAFEIAGKGVANLSSFVNALYIINKIHRNRISNYQNNKEFLKYREHRREKFSIGVPDLN